MGAREGVGHDEWPTQSEHVGGRCEVLFEYIRRDVYGTVVRDDLSSPWETIIRLDDGRYVRSVECQWRPLRGDEAVAGLAGPGRS